MRILTLGLMITLAASAASLRAQVITLDMVPVGNPGNVADPATGSSTVGCLITTRSASTT